MKYLLSVVLMITANLAVAADFEAVEMKLKAAMDAEVRTDKEKERDRNRRPVDTLKFFGLRDDMKVIELIPGGGWYTKLLVPVVQENGEYYAAMNTRRIESLSGEPGFESMQIIADDSNGFGVTDADMVLTFRNYHNLDADRRADMNRKSFNALKSGGVYAVVDHTRRHMEKDTPENGRRVDPVLAIKEIQAAGFDFVDFSTLHYRSDDELRYEVGRKSVTGNTDRWTLKFVKP